MISESAARSYKQPFLLTAVLALVSAVFIGYSVTRAFVWDEGYHLIAAQQIARGKTPYIDFCFPQTPLNAYLNAGIMRLFGEYWRPVHVVAALFCIGSVVLIAQYIFAYFPMWRWRLACAIIAALLIGFNAVLLEFGTVGQAYGIAMFFCVAAYRAAMLAVKSKGWLPALACGLLAGVAADSTLLVAPAALVILVWLWINNRAGGRKIKILTYLAGSAIPFLPVLLLFIKGPEQTFFNIAQYHAIYRRVNWPGATKHDVLVFSSWLDSPQALVLALLAIAGVLFIRQSPWDKARKAEFYLACWIAGAVGLYLCTPHPTFGRYFILIVPFVAIPAAAGLYSVGSKLGDPDHPRLPALVAAALIVLPFLKIEFDTWNDTSWKDYQSIAQKVAQVTPPGGMLFADELVYFSLKQNPPPGLELSYAHLLDLGPEREKLLHIVSQRELKELIKQGKFATFQSCSDDEAAQYGMPGPFRYHVNVEDCQIFWAPNNKKQQ